MDDHIRVIDDQKRISGAGEITIRPGVRANVECQAPDRQIIIGRTITAVPCRPDQRPVLAGKTGWNASRGSSE
jgi:hypothetical protein